MQTCFSIGIERSDGDFHILCTLNNNDGLIKNCAALAQSIRAKLAAITEEKVIILDRQDSPDYINLEEYN